MDGAKYDEIITTQETLKIYHEQKIKTVLNAYPPEKGYEVSILECLPVDSKTERITFSIKKNKDLELSNSLIK